MAKKSMILKQQREAKFSTRAYNRCKICGRPHAYLRNYGICRTAVVPTLTCATTASAVSASVSWRTRARSPA